MQPYRKRNEDQEGSKSFKSWLYKTVRSGPDHREKGNLRHDKQLAMKEWNTAKGSLYKETRRKLIREYLAILTEKERELLSLRLGQGMSNHEISGIILFEVEEVKNA